MKRNPVPASLIFVLPLLALWALLGAVQIPTAQAASTRTVTTPADNGPGSLRQALVEATAGDTIDFAPVMAGQTIVLTMTLNIAKDVTIHGNVPITVSGNHTVTVLQIAGAHVTLSQLTIADGYDSGGGGMKIYGGAVVTLTHSVLRDNSANSGGAILHSGDSRLRISNSRFSGNSAVGGAGILSYSPIAIDHSTFTGNTATAGGGAIQSYSELVVDASTFNANSGSSGGAIMNYSSLVIDNSTFYSNSAVTAGGVFFNGGDLVIHNSTLSHNAAGTLGGAIFESSVATTTVRNSIIAHNDSLIGPNCDGVLIVQDYNLIDVATDCTLTGETAHIIAGRDPLLGPLADNGGPTLTHVLLQYSPALDAGGACGAATDQRGAARPQGAACDLGAVEMAPYPPPAGGVFLPWVGRP